jgi:hypothetical protein
VLKRRHVKHAHSLRDRLKIFSDQLKKQAAQLKPGPEKDALLTRARIADTASHINDWANSSGLQPPK